jgi:hypothetical protein
MAYVHTPDQIRLQRLILQNAALDFDQAITQRVARFLFLYGLGSLMTVGLIYGLFVEFPSGGVDAPTSWWEFFKEFAQTVRYWRSFL